MARIVNPAYAERPPNDLGNEARHLTAHPYVRN